MLKRKWYEWILTIVYIAMVFLCIFLNFSQGHRESLATIIVNIVMFAIVGLIFLCVSFRCFMPMNSMMKDLTVAADKIKKDAMNTRSYLWEPYKAGNVEIFRNKKLAELYQEFVYELNREESTANSYYRPSIEEYINESLVDRVMHRNELNQVAGMLTGLGILGTFIGLSLGLQSFNTGSTAEITSSIEPLMNGIKVAFHTSIYGMVFSLVFNAVYKKKLYDAEIAVEQFVTAFERYVLPDTSNDGMNQLIMLQHKQLAAMKNIPAGITDELLRVIEPQFENLHKTITDFSNVATENQMEAMNRIVERFIEQMNLSLESSFRKLSTAIDEMYQAQTKSTMIAQDALDVAKRSTGDLNAVNRETERLISTLSQYSESIQTIQTELQKTIVSLNYHTDSNYNLLTNEQKTLASQQETIAEMQKAVRELVAGTKEVNEDTYDTLSKIGDSVYFIQRALEKEHAAKAARRKA